MQYTLYAPEGKSYLVEAECLDTAKQIVAEEVAQETEAWGNGWVPVVGFIKKWLSTYPYTHVHN